jgi:hypothetical protein
MATGTGLDAQIGFAAETTVGTPVTVTRFLEFNSESIAYVPTYVDPVGLRVGRKFKRASRVVQSRRTVEGGFELEWPNKGGGLLVAHALGSTATATQISTSGAYAQLHVPGGLVGKGLTVQVGRPEPSGTVRPHTYAGCKITSWEFKLANDGVLTFSAEVDGWDEATATALASASFASSTELFDFRQATLKLGGTPATSSGELAVTSGVAVAAVITELSIKGDNPLATERYGVGQSGTKKEQLENDFPTITGSLTAEFARDELYLLMKNNTTFAFDFAMVGSAIPAGGGNNFSISIIMPACKIKTAAPSVGGPDIVSMSTEFEAYDNAVDAPIQVKIVSSDTSI